MNWESNKGSRMHRNGRACPASDGIFSSEYEAVYRFRRARPGSAGSGFEDSGSVQSLRRDGSSASRIQRRNVRPSAGADDHLICQQWSIGPEPCPRSSIADSAVQIGFCLRDAVFEGESVRETRTECPYSRHGI